MKSDFLFIFQNVTPQQWRHYSLIRAKWPKIHNCSTTFGRNTKYACRLIWGWGIQNWFQFLKNSKSYPRLWRHYALIRVKGRKMQICSTTYARNTTIWIHINLRVKNPKVKSDFFFNFDPQRWRQYPLLRAKGPKIHEKFNAFECNNVCLNKDVLEAAVGAWQDLNSTDMDVSNINYRLSHI